MESGGHLGTTYDYTLDTEMRRDCKFFLIFFKNEGLSRLAWGHGAAAPLENLLEG